MVTAIQTHELMNIVDQHKIAEVSIENNVVHAVFEQDSVITLEHAKKIVKERILLSRHKSYPLYIDIRGVLSIDKEARKYLKSEEAMQLASGAALRVDNPISKFLGNLFITVDKPKKPIKMFNNETKALNWLRKFK